jgi:hypothetical protein
LGHRGWQISVLLAALILVPGCREGSIAGPAEDTRWLAVSAGGAHTCGITEVGFVACWGLNVRGQLGTDPRLTRINRPGLIPGFTTHMAVAAGGSHTCTVDSSGAVWCWGANDRGQLADGTSLDLPRPRRSPVGGGFVGISAGEGHTCALGRDGRVICWGANGHGQAGADPDGTPASGIAPPTPVAGGGLLFTAVSAGGRHSCGLTPSGEAWCWGDNAAGQLGAGPDAPTRSSVPLLVSGGMGFQSISAGGDHTCGIEVGGGLVCWGANDLGQVGDLPDLSVPTPRSPGWIAEAVTVSAAMGPWSCGTGADGALTCWGQRAGEGPGSSGPGEAWDPGEGALFPGSVPGAGLAHGCVLDGEGALWCWGEGSGGELGHGRFTSSSTLVRVGGGAG